MNTPFLLVNTFFRNRTSIGTMTASSSIINRKGMVTIPTKIRKKYNLIEGTEVAFLEIMGNIILVPIMEIEEIRKQMPTAKEMMKSYEESRELEIKLENGE